VSVYERIAEVTARILRLLPEHENAPDPHERDRHLLERERRDLQRELDEELRSRWRDVQALKEEQRRLRNERTAELQSYVHNLRDYAA
jgi:hypothetical protein